MSAKVDITVTLAGYQIREQLYSGSRTLVYGAVREADNQDVVIKLLKPEYPSFEELVQFRNQYVLAKNLQIPGIIQPYSLEPYHNGYALVMEDFGGVSLRQFIQEQPQHLEQFLTIALQLTDILHQLHQQRVIHKDIKPANILIHPDTKLLRLIDFSISSFLPKETTEIQNSHVLEGSPAYLSPEQTGRINRGIDYRSDLYSLGVSFFELLTKKLPFDSQDPMELVHCHITKLPANVCDVNSEIPLVVGEILYKLMAKNAEDRYQSALGLKHDLHLCKEQLKEIGKIEHFPIAKRDVSDRLQEDVENQKKLKEWANYAPTNHVNKFYLAEAEECRVLGRMSQAMDYYDRAIAFAKANAYIQEEALSNELAGKFYLQWGKERIAQLYMQEAYYCWFRHGDKAKVADLEQRYPHLLKEIVQQGEASLTTSDTICGNSTSEACFKKIVDNIPGMVYKFCLATDGSISTPYVSSGCYDLYEVDPKAVMAGVESLYLMTHPDDRSGVEELIADSARMLTSFSHECRIVTASGKIKWIQSVCRPELQADGSIVWDGVVIEISDVHNELHLRKQVEAALQEKEHFLTSIYNGAEMVIVVVDVLDKDRFHYVGWNIAAERASGIRSVDTIGKTPIELFGLVEGEILQQRLAKCAETGTPIYFEDRLTFYGQETWWFVNFNPLTNTEGRIYRIIITTFDISDRKRTEAQLNQRTTELEQTVKELQYTQMQMIQSEKMSGLGQLVAGVAHEINNPVNFIFGNLSHANEYTENILRLLELYQKHYPIPHPEIQEEAEAMDLEFLVEDLPKLIDSMRVGAERIQKIVVSLRTFSRMDEAEMKEVNIHEGIDSTLMILQHRLKAKPDSPNIEVIKAYGELPLIECYAGQLNQVFMNLLSNAIDALEEANIKHQILTPTITISTTLVESKQVVIKIADNGLGIPAHIQQRLFDPFFTTKAVGKGTGMGLSISYQIVVEKHKGTLQCVSEPGQGGTFIVIIPICQS